MKRTPILVRTVLVIGLASAAGYTLAVALVSRRHRPPQPAPISAAPDRQAEPARADGQTPVPPALLSESALPAPALPEPAGVASAGEQPPGTAKLAPQAKPGTQDKPARQTAQAPQAPGSGKTPIQDLAARAALSFVGFDPLAEEVWGQAINDPDLPAEERKDLIEDLNEDGFPDPHNVTMDDLPLILIRIGLIELLAPDAMDEVNLAAFEEAYKDLVNMYARLTSQ